MFASIGIDMHGPDCIDIDRPVKAVDMAMSMAKRGGKSSYRSHENVIKI